MKKIYYEDFNFGNQTGIKNNQWSISEREEEKIYLKLSYIYGRSCHDGYLNKKLGIFV